MTKRMYIPAMRRDILYLVVEKAVVDSYIDTENQEEVVGQLKGCFKDDSGFHFLITQQGTLICDRQLQRPADAATYYNAEGVAVGYIVKQDESGAMQKITAAQVATVRTAVMVLRRIFPKATVKVIKNSTLEKILIEDEEEGEVDPNL